MAPDEKLAYARAFPVQDRVEDNSPLKAGAKDAALICKLVGGGTGSPSKWSASRIACTTPEILSIRGGVDGPSGEAAVTAPGIDVGVTVYGRWLLLPR